MSCFLYRTFKKTKGRGENGGWILSANYNLSRHPFGPRRLDLRSPGPPKAKSRPLRKFRLRSRPQKSFFRVVYSGTIHRCIHATSFRISERQLKWSGIRTSKMSWPASGNWNLPFWHPNCKVVLPMVFSIRVDTFKVSPSPNISLSLFMILGWFSYNKNLLPFGSDAWEFVMTYEIC